MDDIEVLRKVVGLYKNQRLLWDPKQTEYYNKNKRDDAWCVISTEVNIPVAELKKKLNSMLGSYRREKSREKKSKMTGSAASKIYKSKWFAYHWFDFLLKKNTPSDTTDTMSGEKQNISQEEAENEMKFSNISSVSQDMTGTPSTSKGERNVMGALRVNDKSTKRKCTNDNNETMLKDVYKILKTTAVTDHFDSFGNHVANELRKYDPQLVPHVKKAILDILFEADIGQFPYIRQGYYTGYQTSSTYVPSPDQREESSGSPTVPLPAASTSSNSEVEDSDIDEQKFSFLE